MNVSVTPKLAKYVASKIAAGDYASASELIRESLRRMEEHETFWSDTRRCVKRGLADIKRGDDFDGETVMAELRDRLHRNGRKRKAS
jgi:putative addiction module CopG family antidote